jgi:hypothetical protein
MPPSPTILDDLRRVYEKGELIVFVGAGVSRAGGLPALPELAQRLLDRVRGDGRAASLEVQAIERSVQQEKFIEALSALKDPGALGELEFNIEVSKALDDSDRPIPEVALAIARLGPKLRAVLTTNVDRFLERAFFRTGADWETFTDPPFDLPQAEHYILKLHGTRRHQSTWVFTEEQYDKATFGRPEHRAVFETIFRSSRILFIGYELDDDDFKQTLSTTRALAGESPPEHFALLPGPVPQHRRTSLEKAGLRLLVYDDHAELPGILDSIPPRARRRKAQERRAERARRRSGGARVHLTDRLRLSPPRARPLVLSAWNVPARRSSTSSATGAPSSAHPLSCGPSSAPS